MNDSNARITARAVATLAAFVAAFVAGFVAAFVAGAGSAHAQLINEVLAQNSTQTPVDIRGGHPDLVELYNDTGAELVLGTGVPRTSFALSDTLVFVAERALVFEAGRATLAAGGRLLIFCDGNQIEGTCELHAPFDVASDGSEALTVWGPEAADGTRPVVDRVFLPPLADDVSFGRFPDGAGGPNLPLDEHFDHFVFYPPGRSSFGSCTSSGGACSVNQLPRRLCSGAPNRAPMPSDNVPPSVTRIDESTNAPRAGEPVQITARVRDERLPLEPNIARVELIWRVEPAGGAFGSEQTVLLVLDTSVGQGGLLDAADRGRPLDFFSHWRGAIPGQPAGSRVEFYFRVEDQQGATATRPASLCHLLPEYGEGIGPCDREFGPISAGCVRDAVDSTCEPDDPDAGEPVVGERFISCTPRSTYKVAHAATGGREFLVINEVVPAQQGLLRDPSELGPCVPGDVACDVAANPQCCLEDEDFLELHNSSGAPVDISGCWLSDSFFQPQGWTFPSGSVIPAGGYVIVWLDRDGSKCPDPDRIDKPCFWECPDPNERSKTLDPPQFHASFAIDADGDQIFLFDSEASGFGLLHGLDFGNPPDICGFTQGVNSSGGPTNDVRPNQSMALIPDGDRDGRFVIVDTVTPGAPNQGRCPDVVFRRGDATGDGGSDISDGVTILNFLFLGGRRPDCLDAADSDDNGVVELSDAVRIFGFLFLGGTPPASPGPVSCGPDVNEDGLGDCEYAAGC